MRKNGTKQCGALKSLDLVGSTAQLREGNRICIWREATRRIAVVGPHRKSAQEKYGPLSTISSILLAK